MAYSSMKAIVIGAFFLAFAAQGTKVNVTPIQKVVSLLDDLSDKLTKEGEKEAAEYDKFACFCKDEATKFQLGQEKSAKKIAELKATVEDLDAGIKKLNRENQGHLKEVETEEKNVEKQTAKRAATHDAFLKESQDIKEAIRSTDDAVDDLTGAKGAQKKEWNDQTDFMQYHEKAVALLQKFTSEGRYAGPIKADLGKGTNTITALLEKMRASFKANLAKVEADEGNAKFASDSRILASRQIITVTNKQIDENEQVISSKTADKEKATEDKDQETVDKASDASFLKVLTAQCEEKAGLFDQRSKSRSNELNAITQAVAALEKGMPPKGTVGKMAEIQSFLQLRGANSRAAGEQAALKRVRAYLAKVVKRTSSVSISTLAVRVQVAGDHFAKVRELMKDLKTKLEEDAKSEATQKGICDKAMKSGTRDRDRGTARMEAANSQITTLTAENAELNDDIADLRQKIADNKKALNEASELRNDEKADNENTVALSKNGIAGVERAIEVLNKYYNSFAQTATHKYKPPKSDREGKTFDDRAPDVFQEKYSGAQDDATGILAILEVVLSDFKGVQAKTEKDEKAAQQEFDKLEKTINGDNAAKQKTVDKKKGEVKSNDSDLLQQGDELKEAEDQRNDGLTKIEDNREDCLDGGEGEDFEARKQARLTEIASLKEAAKILDNWKD